MHSGSCPNYYFPDNGQYFGFHFDDQSPLMLLVTDIVACNKGTCTYYTAAAAERGDGEVGCGSDCEGVLYRSSDKSW